MEIPLATRYQAAWAEINQRLNLRQISYLGHATACAAIAKLISDRINPPRPANSSITNDVLWALSPAIISLAFACWIRSHDLMIGLLSTYCGACENPGETNDTTLPAWHSPHQDWHKAATKQREWMELAFVVLNTLLAELATLYCTGNWEGHGTAIVVVLSVNHFVLGLSSWVVLSVRNIRSRLAKTRFIQGHLYPPIHSPHPFDLLATVGLTAGFGGLLGYAVISAINKTWPQEPWIERIAGAITLALAVGARGGAIWLDFQARENSEGTDGGPHTRQRLLDWLRDPRKRGKILDPHWSSSRWVAPVSAGVLAFILLVPGVVPLLDYILEGETWLHYQIVGHAYQGVILLGMVLLGYGLPELLQTWYRFCRTFGRKSWRIWAWSLPSVPRKGPVSEGPQKVQEKEKPGAK